MSLPADQVNPPKCARLSCDNTTSKCARPRGGIIWKKYCCPSCQEPKHKGISKYHFDAVPPVCTNPKCTKLVKSRDRIHTGWNKYCSSSCQRSMIPNITHTPETKKRLSNASLTLWENRSPGERDFIFSKSRKSRFTLKEYKFLSGKLIYVMGNEPKALDELLLNYKEAEIIAGDELSLAMPYIRLDGKKGRYYPDIYIPKDNLIIEVKSVWTYAGTDEKLKINRLKEQACLAAGYNFRFMIY
jgi:hypothetical protein